jgi:hypothetical protein
MKNKVPTQISVAKKMMELTGGKFSSNERVAAVFLNNILLGKRKLPIQFQNTLLEVYGLASWEELEHFFPKLKDPKDTEIGDYFIKKKLIGIEIEVKKGKAEIAKHEIASVFEAISILQSKGLELALKVEFLLNK